MSFYILTTTRGKQIFNTDLSLGKNSTPPPFEQDLRRTIFLLDENERVPYLKALLDLNQKDTYAYSQGNMEAQSDLILLVTTLQSENNAASGLVNDCKPIALRMAYLRADKELGGISINFDPIAKHLIIAIVEYPSDSPSFEQAIVTYILPETVGKKYLQPALLNQLPSTAQSNGGLRHVTTDDMPAQETWAIIDVKELSTALHKILNNKNLSQLIDPILDQPELITLDPQLSNATLLSKFTKSTLRPKVGFQQQDAQAENIKSQEELTWHVLTYKAAHQAIEWAQYRLFFEQKKRRFERLTTFRGLSLPQKKHINQCLNTIKQALTEITHQEIADKAAQAEGCITHQNAGNKRFPDFTPTERDNFLLKLFIHKSDLEGGLLIQQLLETTQHYLTHLENSTDRVAVLKKSVIYQAIDFLKTDLETAQTRPRDLQKTLQGFEKILSKRENSASKKTILMLRREEGSSKLNQFCVNFLKVVATLLATVLGFGIGGYLAYQRLFTPESVRYLRTVETDIITHQQIHKDRTRQAEPLPLAVPFAH